MVKKFFLKKVKYYLPDWRQRMKKSKRIIWLWFDKLIRQLVSLAAYFICTFVGFVLLVCFIRYIWFFVQHTPVMQQSLSQERSFDLVDIIYKLNAASVSFCFEICLDGLKTCFIVSLAAHFTALRRSLFDCYGIIHKAILWYGPCVAAAAFNVFDNTNFLSFSTGLFFYFFPVCCLLGQCMILSGYLIPEITVLSNIRKIKQFRETARIRNIMNDKI